MEGKIVSLEDRIPKLKQQRRKKANRRLILLLSLFFSLILIIGYVQSPLSHVKDIVVKGNEFYSSNEIIGMTGLSNKTNIWKVKKQTISARLEHLPEIRKAIVKIDGLNTIEIQITEYKKLAYLKTADSVYSPILQNGTILYNRKTDKIPINAPILIDFKEGTALSNLLKGLGKLPTDVINSISEIKYTPNNLDPMHITLYMNDGFEVSAAITDFSDKMSHYPSIISQLDPNNKGVIDLEVGSYFKAYAPVQQGNGTVGKK